MLRGASKTLSPSEILGLELKYQPESSGIFWFDPGPSLAVVLQ